MKADNRVDISFENLRDNYRIIGRLGKPVGKYASIQGVWKSVVDIKRFKGKRMFFHITHVDGYPLKKKIVYSNGYINTSGGLPLDPPLPEPTDSDVWELRVVETLMHFGTPKRYYEESGVPAGSFAVHFRLTSQLIYHRRPQIRKRR